MAPGLHRRLWSPFVLVFATVLAGAAGAQAGTVALSLPELANHAGQVIVGTVAGVRPYWADDPRRIESEITLERVEYLKGRLADSTDRFALIVPGGEVDGTRMTVGCAPEFRVGERWILFLLPTYRNHPVVGLHQGAFLVRPDADGVERVMSRHHGAEAAVAEIGADGFVEHVQRAADAREHVRAAHHVRVIAADASEPQSMTYADFVARLAPILAVSREHHLTAPAGRPVFAHYRAVPLRPAPTQQGANGADHRPVPRRGQGGARTAPPTTRPAAGEGVAP